MKVSTSIRLDELVNGAALAAKTRRCDVDPTGRESPARSTKSESTKPAAGTSAGDGSDNGESCTGVTCAATGVVNLLADLPLLLASAAAAHDGEELDATR